MRDGPCGNPCPGVSPGQDADRGGTRPRPGGAPLGEGVVEGVPMPAAARAVAALRAFSAGNGYLPGQVVDRLL